MRNQNHQDENLHLTLAPLLSALILGLRAGKDDSPEQRSAHMPGSGFREPTGEEPAGEKGAVGLHVVPCQHRHVLSTPHQPPKHKALPRLSQVSLPNHMHIYLVVNHNPEQCWEGDVWKGS